MWTPKHVVVVGGCGHVGLPLGLLFASRGLHVTLLDIDKAKVEKVNRGEMPFLEQGAPELLQQVVGKGLEATLDDACLASADAAIAVVGTPVDKYLNPTLRNLCRSVDDLLNHLPDDALLVLRSTVYPGVTKIVYDRVRALGRKVHVAFCPERISEGKALEELTRLPQIVAAFEPEAMARAGKLFSILSPEIIELEPTEAELAKLFTNSWRYLNFAISNQFYVLAQSYGLDFYRIYDAVTRDYPRMASFSRAGFAAGPCLLKDTLQLAAFTGNNFFMGHAAMLVNEGLPNYLVAQLRPCRTQPRRAWRFWAWPSRAIPTMCATAFPTSCANCWKSRRAKCCAPILTCRTHRWFPWSRPWRAPISSSWALPIPFTNRSPSP